MLLHARETPMTHAAPVASAERITALDTLRGFAVLGILVMNVQSFSMPLPAYLNPTAYGDLGGANGWVWRLSHLFFDQKFMTIFSLLFGAGIFLFTTRAEAKGESPRRLHYRRMLWLLLFGLAHAYALWYGDILVSYALCGMLVYPFRRRSPATLLIVGVVLIALGSALWIFFGWSMQYWPEEEINSLLDKDWQPRPEALAAELGAYRGGWWTQMNHRVPTSFEFQTFLFLIGVVWRVCGLMLAGMALYKLGVVTAQRTRNFFAAMFAAGMLGGVPLVAYGIARNVAAGWDVRYSFFHGSQFNYWGSLLVCAGWIGMVMLAASAGPRIGVNEPTASPMDDLVALAVHKHVGLAGDLTAGGSSLEARITEPTLFGAIQFLPGGILTFLFRPVIFEAHNPLAFAAAFDGTLLAFLVLWRWRHLLMAARAAVNRPLIAFCWVAFLPLLAGLSFEANFGVIVRHRIMVLPFLFLFLAVPTRQEDSADAPEGQDSSTRPVQVPVM